MNKTERTNPLARLLAVFALACACLPALAVDEADLLPVDDAFVVEASAVSRERIEVRWRIADGYYLYRHRTDVTAGAGFTAKPVRLPKGEAHDDEFFGAVETYRSQLVAVLPGAAAPGSNRVTLQVKYQGCADAGICYPPQTRQLIVALPAAGLPATANAAARGLPLFGKQAPGAVNGAGLPLPQEQAFALDAITYDSSTLLLRLTPAPGYYIYRDRTTMRLQGAPGIVAGKPRWPKAAPHRDDHFGDVAVYFDQAEVPIPLKRSHGDAAEASLEVTFQGCQNDGICYPPMTRSLALSIPAAASGSWGAAAAAPAGSQASETVEATPPGAAEEGVVPAAASDPAPAPPSAATAVSAPADVPRTLPPEDVVRRSSRAPASLAIALLLALAGGLILNLMPCVLPVLSLKALSLAESGRSGGHARSSALWYTAGVLVSFVTIGAVAIALRAAGQALGWGFQLQQPLVIGLLAYLMFAVGLSLSGVFALGHRFAGTGHALMGRTGPMGDFFTGVLAVVIASPCTAPFMGAALAFAFTSSTPVALLVFAVLGLGLALPFLLIAFVPSLARRLPQPGPWMETMKQFLAFPMYLTAAWLLWVLGKQRGVDALGLAMAGMVALALGLWWYQRLRFQAAPLRRGLAVALLLLALVPLVLAQRLALAPPQVVVAGSGIEAYSPQRLAALRGQGRVVFVEMTADWCVTCKANDRAVLSGKAFRDSLAQVDAAFMRGDWTNVDPQITAFLEQHEAVGVPLYVVFPATGGPGEVLPTVLTQNIVAAALARARQ